MPVHFEFGMHVNERDARYRLRDAIERRPAVLVVEGLPALPDSLARVSADEAVEYARGHYSRMTAKAEQLTKGVFPYNKMEEDAMPYLAKRARMVARENSGNPGRVKVVYEPFSPEPLRQEYEERTTPKPYHSIDLLKDRLEGDLKKQADAHIAREKRLVDFLAGLDAQHPGKTILVDFGGAHEHIEDQLKAKGVKTSSRFTPGTQAIKPHEILLPTYMRDGLGLPHGRWANDRELNLRRHTLAALLHRSIGEQRADQAVEELKDDQANELYEHLKGKPGDLSVMGAVWLATRKK